MRQRRNADPESPGPAGPVPDGPSLPPIPLIGFTRRRAAFILAAVIVLWIVAIFARQVGEASAAVARADAMRSQNAALQGEVATLQQERVLVQSKAFIQQQARAYGLGARNEHAFALAPNAPPLPADAPGSASVRLGVHQPTAHSPLESWLELLFGPAPG